MEIFQTVVVDDGKGRAHRKQEPDRELKYTIEFPPCNPGEYTFFKSLGFTTDFLCLACPYCGTAQPTGYLTKILCKQPLTVEDAMWCPICEERFHIIEGKAYKAWLTPEL